MTPPTLLTSAEDLTAYQEYLKNAPGSPLWQSLEWKAYQEALGRETRLYALQRAPQRGAPTLDASALVIIDKTAFGLSTWDIPRGPLGNNPEAVQSLLEGIVEEARREGVMALYFSPSASLDVVRCSLFVLRFVTKNEKRKTIQRSNRHEQPEATLTLDLSLSEEELQKQMKPKCRYNIGVALKHGVTVEQSKDIDAFFGLLKGTSARDAFGILPKKNYERFLKDLPGSFLLLAYKAGSGKQEATRNEHSQRTADRLPLTAPIAGLLGVMWGRRGYYYYGASSYADRALMAPYALQWEAIRLCKARNCLKYDFLGIAPEGEVDHVWAGVTRFKMQFGGEVETYPPEQEIVLKPVAKKLLGWKRKVWR